MEFRLSPSPHYTFLMQTPVESSLRTNQDIFSSLCEVTLLLLPFVRFRTDTYACFLSTLFQ